MMKMKFRNGFSKIPVEAGMIGLRVTRSLDTKSALHEIITINILLNEGKDSSSSPLKV